MTRAGGVSGLCLPRLLLVVSFLLLTQGQSTTDTPNNAGGSGTPPWVASRERGGVTPPLPLNTAQGDTAPSGSSSTRQGDVSNCTECDTNAVCLEVNGSLICRCQYTWSGNGTYCMRPIYPPSILSSGARTGFVTTLSVVLLSLFTLTTSLTLKRHRLEMELERQKTMKKMRVKLQQLREEEIQHYARYSNHTQTPFIKRAARKIDPFKLISSDATDRRRISLASILRSRRRRRSNRHARSMLVTSANEGEKIRARAKKRQSTPSNMKPSREQRNRGFSISSMLKSRRRANNHTRSTHGILDSSSKPPEEKQPTKPHSSVPTYLLPRTGPGAPSSSKLPNASSSGRKRRVSYRDADLVAPELYTTTDGGEVTQRCPSPKSLIRNELLSMDFGIEPKHYPKRPRFSMADIQSSEELKRRNQIAVDISKAQGSTAHTPGTQNSVMRRRHKSVDMDRAPSLGPWASAKRSGKRVTLHLERMRSANERATARRTSKGHVTYGDGPPAVSHKEVKSRPIASVPEGCPDSPSSIGSRTSLFINHETASEQLTRISFLPSSGHDDVESGDSRNQGVAKKHSQTICGFPVRKQSPGQSPAAKSPASKSPAAKSPAAKSPAAKSPASKKQSCDPTRTTESSTVVSRLKIIRRSIQLDTRPIEMVGDPRADVRRPIAYRKMSTKSPPLAFFKLRKHKSTEAGFSSLTCDDEIQYLPERCQEASTDESLDEFHRMSLVFEAFSPDLQCLYDAVSQYSFSGPAADADRRTPILLVEQSSAATMNGGDSPPNRSPASSLGYSFLERTAGSTESILKFTTGSPDYGPTYKSPMSGCQEDADLEAQHQLQQDDSQWKRYSIASDGILSDGETPETQV